MDIERYFEQKEAEWEDLCVRCGSCCGAYEDPCVHLKRNGEAYYCDIYKDRFGLRRTVSGEEFYCVEFREVINESWPGSYRCAYKKIRNYYAKSDK